MKLAVEVGGRTRMVEIQRGVSGPQVILDDRPLPLDVAAGPRFWSLLFGTRAYEVVFADAPGGLTIVHVDGRPVQTVVTGAGQFGAAARRARGIPQGGDGPQRLVAPMPGRIVKLLVGVGDVVVPRQGLVVIEAMKMENELRSAREGTVTEILVAEGASVEAGTLVAVVEHTGKTAADRASSGQ